MALKRNGFTMIEQILSLMTILIILPVVHTLILYLNKPEGKYSLEVNDASNAIYEMLLEASHVSVNKNSLYFEDPENQAITIEKYKDVLRRRVSGEGHQVILHQLKDITFNREADILEIIIVMNNDEMLTRYINLGVT